VKERLLLLRNPLAVRSLIPPVAAVAVVIALSSGAAAQQSWPDTPFQ